MTDASPEPRASSVAVVESVAPLRTTAGTTSGPSVGASASMRTDAVCGASALPAVSVANQVSWLVTPTGTTA